jgi:hypothetical protein
MKSSVEFVPSELETVAVSVAEPVDQSFRVLFRASKASDGRAEKYSAKVLCRVIKADVDQGLGISRISHSPAAEISTSLFSKKSSSLDSKMWSIMG